MNGILIFVGLWGWVLYEKFYCGRRMKKFMKVQNAFSIRVGTLVYIYSWVLIFRPINCLPWIRRDKLAGCLISLCLSPVIYATYCRRRFPVIEVQFNKCVFNIANKVLDVWYWFRERLLKNSLVKWKRISELIWPDINTLLCVGLQYTGDGCAIIISCDFLFVQ